MTPLVIFIGQTYIKFHTRRNGEIEGTTLNIFNFLRKKLAEWDYEPSIKKWTLSYKYYDYDKENQLCILPRYALDEFITFLDNSTEVIYENLDPVVPRKISLRIKDKFKPREDQPKIIEFMTRNGKGFKPVALATGGGKTFCSEYSICLLKETALVVLGQLIEQWYSSIREHTNISDKDIYIIQGFDSLKKLWQAHLNKKIKLRPKIILAAAKTLYAYAVEPSGMYLDLPNYDKFQEEFGIGIKIVDECHLNFHNTVMIDLHSNIETNIYLSATYERSSSQCKRIFNLVFPPAMKYGEQFAKKYTVVYMVSYSLMLPRVNFKRSKGYMHALYETFLLKHRSYFLSYWTEISYLIKRFYLELRKEGQKLLILAQTREFCEQLLFFVRKDFNTCKSELYFSSDKKANREDIFNSDIIISTIKSSSTGLDIKGLKTAINTVSFSSSPQAAQVMGRLRQIPDEETIFVDIWNPEVKSQMFHMRNRLDVYRNKALRIEMIKR